ncbi:MAG: hypothetical protein NTW50_00730 [Candidatus Berkelbacteria bacterium]|nr:hypothetical protein [Candidatus Berkelbacteria bacterium]
MRDNLWLEQKLEQIWNQYFGEVPKLNEIKIKFGFKAKRRLASIRQKDIKNKCSDTQILVTGFFQDERVPEYVVDVTLAHEICHYVHGFASPLPKFSRYPHRGSLVDTELRERGLGKLLAEQNIWLKSTWHEIVGRDYHKRKLRRRKVQRSIFDLFSIF